jgi:hypothetical protein
MRRYNAGGPRQTESAQDALDKWNRQGAHDDRSDFNALNYLQEEKQRSRLDWRKRFYGC